MKEALILIIVLVMGLRAIYYKKKLDEEKEMRELEHYFVREILKKCIKEIPKKNKGLIKEIKDLTQ